MAVYLRINGRGKSTLVYPATALEYMRIGMWKQDWRQPVSAAPLWEVTIFISGVHRTLTGCNTEEEALSIVNDLIGAIEEAKINCDGDKCIWSLIDLDQVVRAARSRDGGGC